MPKKTLKILDIGCGDIPYLKYYTSDLKKNKIFLIGIDPDIKIISLAQIKAIRYGVTKNIVLKKMTAENLKFKHFFFDYIFLFNTYAHLNNVDKSFKEVFRVLRDGGAIFLRDSYDFPDSVRFIRNMHKNNHTATHVIEKLKENYFSIRYINENRECDKVYWRIVAMKNTFGYKINKKIEKDFKNRKI